MGVVWVGIRGLILVIVWGYESGLLDSDWVYGDGC